ncbi:group 1 truncated hemoglobin [Homoserinibacter sp. GY 40078]|uniref:group I truncated hemoglobin n=1 Tax=Homoserinibacter sp. GY 40078 TaxID=2603275 RepID=UPI0011CAF742|nr:group 1 truncated hemoglobin [Homoserinibacter sp. GY 40078]TXK19455.1 group 1 truncated hemoglobin [Homoserinibacter sp. GY 40078]
MTLYRRLGGADAVARVVDLLYDRALADELVGPLFAGVDMARLRAHQTDFLIAAIGGPERYEGAGLRAAHSHLRVDDARFDRMVQLLAEVLADAGIDPALADDVLGRVSRLRVAVVASV